MYHVIKNRYRNNAITNTFSFIIIVRCEISVPKLIKPHTGPVYLSLPCIAYPVRNIIGPRIGGAAFIFCIDCAVNTQRDSRK